MQTETLRRVLVTGSSGFIGQRLVARLRQSGAHVIGVDRVPGRENVNEWLTGDITNPDAWGKAVRGVDTVFHLAGKVHALAARRDEAPEYFRVNTQGTRLVLTAAREHGVRRFVLFSTVKAMSRRELEAQPTSVQVRAWDETDVIEPDTPYGRSKLEAEHDVLGKESVTEPVVLRLCAVYGPAAKGNLQRMLRAIMLRRFPPLPPAENLRSMVHVDDAVEAAILAATHPLAPRRTFIVSDGAPYSTADIARLMYQALGRRTPRWHVPARALETLAALGDGLNRLVGRRVGFDSDALSTLSGSAWFSSARITRELGFIPKWTLPSALPEMILAVSTRPGDRP